MNQKNPSHQKLTHPSIGVEIIGTGQAIPDKVLSNEDLKQYMETSDEWIRQRMWSGCVPRRSGQRSKTRASTRAKSTS